MRAISVPKGAFAKGLLGVSAASGLLAITAVLAVAGCRREDQGDHAGTVHVAVASNFAEPVRELARRFEERTGYEIVLSFGSTGKHHAQIRNGGPFDAFLAADVERPRLLEAEGRAVVGSRFTYAIGRVVLWSPDEGLVDARGDVLKSATFGHLAIANPRLAPYGAAAREVLIALGVWEALQAKIVRGENISQTLHFVQSGAAELGFVAASQVARPDGGPAGSCWEVPQSLYTPIEQQAVLLKEGVAARAFLAFVRSGEALDIIRGYGYDIP